MSLGRHLHDSASCNVTETFPGNSANIRLRVWLASIPQIRGEFNTLIIDSSWKFIVKIISVPSRCLWRRLGVCRYSELVRGGQRVHTKHFYVKFLCWSINLFLIRPLKFPNYFNPIAIMPLNHNEKTHPFQREGGGQKYFLLKMKAVPVSTLFSMEKPNLKRFYWENFQVSVNIRFS